MRFARFKNDNKTLQILLTSKLGNDIFMLTIKLVGQGGYINE